MLDVIFRPLEDWPIAETTDRRGSRHFKAGWGDTLSLLEKELSHLDASNLVIQIQTTPEWIRNDGWPYSNARVTGPKVAIAFKSKFGNLTYRCDDCSVWTHNIRCIAMTLERLRMAEMYGVTKRGEQYQGFKALGSGIQLDAMGPQDAKICIANASNLTPGEINSVTLGGAYKEAAMRTHPDRPSGDSKMFQRVQMAFETLKRHWGIL